MNATNREHLYLYGIIPPLAVSIAIHAYWAAAWIAMLAIRQAIVCAILSAHDAIKTKEQK